MAVSWLTGVPLRVPYLAQGNDAVPGPGIGNVASQAGLTVKEVKEIVEAYCA